MEIREHLAALRRDGSLLCEAARVTDLDAPVPACPGWALRDLLAHLGYVHRWATGYVRDGLTRPVEVPNEEGVLRAAPPDAVIREWFAEGHAALLAALSAAPADLDCWTFLEAPSPLAFWARRQAHETAIHRVDGEQTAGRELSPIDPDFAVDGLAELLRGFLARRRRYDAPDAATALVAIEPTDRRARFLTWMTPEALEPAEPGTPVDADLVIRAPAADCYLLLWNRRGPEGLVVTGAELVGQWRERFRVRWS